MSQRLSENRIGLVGLGLMGRGIGLSLLRAGYALGILAHRSRDTAEELLRAGAWEASSASELADRSDVLVLCLPSLEAVEHVLFGAEGVTASRRNQLLIVESSTLTPGAAVDFAGRLEANGIAFVDAPVTRGPKEAAAGQLNALVGGRPDAVRRAAPVLEAFCERIFLLGPLGHGYAAKLVNNFLGFSNLVAVAEAMSTASRAGLDLPTLMQALAASGGQSRVLDGLAPVITGTGSSRSQVTLRTAHKDADYYHRFARTLGTAGPVADGLVERLSEALRAGLADRYTPDYLALVAHAASLPTD